MPHTRLAGCLATLITIILGGGALYAGWRLGPPLGWALAGSAALVVCLRLFLWVRRLGRGARPSLEEVDAMDGLEFELFVADLLEQQGWRVEVTRGSGDLGVDVVACHSEERWAVQVKRQEAPVSRRAVSDAVAGRDHYDCTDAMVVTNSTFTRGAVELAESTGCELVDREELAEWIALGRRR